MTRMSRQIFVAVAFAATVAAAVTGVTMTGVTADEAPTVAEICARADWPNIPAECLGETDRSVRYVTGAEASAIKFVAVDMSDRFAVAFQ